ncbi:dihydroorotase protein, putative [Eimeria necatrix]|uniref:dihydroorotase n=1 Tax=Eimeria necatrix TaxID=51315 RepID=U6MN34_9EIME|nr:dihydroorotase protein, putative [Eimeria necatrix]CDJ63889.1 dihydroorotase protein, putative [Eimeria necatrix]
MVMMGLNGGRLVMPMADDMHTHLRQVELMDMVTLQIRKGGCNRVLVMPNTVPPIVTCSQALEYRNELLKRDPNVNYLMTLYLCREIDAEDIAKRAKESHVVGVKLYPRGVTTNSEAGVEDLTQYEDIFKVMEELGMSLHIHAEKPEAPTLHAEEMFLPIFEDLHSRFPKLKIVFEHISTAAAVKAIKGKPNVAASITAHHLRLTTEDVWTTEDVQRQMDSSDKSSVQPRIAQSHNFCKPIAKSAEDREALLQVVREGHPQQKKDSYPPAAGVFTQPFLLAYLADTFARAGCLDKLQSFACENAAAFFGLPKKELVEGEDCVVLEQTPCTIPNVICGAEGTSTDVVPFLAGHELGYTLKVVPFSRSLEARQ